MTCPCESSCAGKNPKNALEVLKACEPTLFHTVKRPASLGDDTVTPPEQLDYKNVLLVYLANGHAYLYSSDGVPTFISYLPTNVAKLEAALQELQEDLAKEALARHEADTELMQMIEALKNSPDVVDIVHTYADLEAYDTASLGDKDIIRVLDDETHNNASTYYRWDKAEGKWDYIGQTNPGIVSSDKPGYIKVEDDQTATWNGYEGMQHDVDNLLELTQGRETPVLPPYVYGSNLANLQQHYVAENTASGGSLPRGYKYMVAEIPKYSTVNGEKQVFPDEILYPVMDLSNIPYGGPQAGLMLLADKQKLDKMLEVTAVGDGLTLEDGVLSASGGGSPVTLLDTYTAEPEEGSVYDAEYANHRLDNQNGMAVLGTPALSFSPEATGRGIVLLGKLPAEWGYSSNKGKLDMGNGTVVLGASSLGSSASVGNRKYYYGAVAIGSVSAYSGAVGIGANNVTVGESGVAIGNSTYVGRNLNGIAVGYNAKVGTGFVGSAALGSWSAAGRSYEVSIGNPTQSTPTRFLANVTAGELPTDAVNLQQMQDYVAEHGGGGGGSTTLYDTYTAEPATGSAYSATYTNNRLDAAAVRLGSGIAVTGLRANYADTGVLVGDGIVVADRTASSTTASTLNGIAIGQGVQLTRGASMGSVPAIGIGAGAVANGQSVAIGRSASSTVGYGLALGSGAVVSSNGSVALGYGAKTSREAEVSIGAGGTAGYVTRILANVTAGVNDTDAVNVAQLNAATGRAKNLPLNVFYNVTLTDYNQDNITLNLLNKDLATGGDSTTPLELMAAVPATGGNAGSAGIMSVTQATTLAALAEAYEQEEKGIELYSGTASVNTIELSQPATNFDHIRVIAEYMSMGSSAMEQSVVVDFYPTTDTHSFQMTATDITVGDTPMVTTYQDIWMLSDDGIDLDVVGSFKAEQGNGTLTCTPDTTSQFTIKRVVGFGKLV